MPKFKKLDFLRDRPKATSASTASTELNAEDVARWVGSASLGKASSYVSRAVSNARRAGNVLKADYQGTFPAPYRVQVTLGKQGITSASCSCPVGEGGRCKHVAAVILTYLDDPDAFTEVPDLDTALEQRSKSDLIALVRMMLARHPDLETLLDMPVPGSGTEPVDPNLVRRQVLNVIKSHDYHEWGETYAASQDLQEMLRLAGVYGDEGDWHNAATIYHTLAHEILDHYDSFYDEDGEVSSVVQDCVTGLGEALAAITDAERRKEIVRALWDIYLWDINYGGIGIGDLAPETITENATPEEKQLAAGWVRSVIGKLGHSYSDWKSSALGGFLLDLEADTLDDEEYLRVCRETGRDTDLVTRLLELGRVAEAEKAAGEVSDHRLLLLADIFVEHGHPDVAERLVRKRLSTSGVGHFVSQFASWLKKRVEERGDHAEALALAQQLFWQYPNLKSYEEVRRLAAPLGEWDTLRSELQARLTDKRNYRLLTEIHLAENQVDAALETVKHIGGGGYSDWRWSGDPLSIHVARAAEQSRPRDAIRLYVEEVKRLIDARGRHNYEVAARYLTRVRKLYKELGETPEWDALIASIRENNRTLRALKEELNKARL